MSDLSSPSRAALPSLRLRWLTWLDAAATRRAQAEAIRRSGERLASYDDHLLDDIGLSREQAIALTRGAARRRG